MTKQAPSTFAPEMRLTFAEICFVILELGLGKTGRTGWRYNEIDNAMPDRGLGLDSFGSGAVRAWFKGVNLPRQRLTAFKTFFLWNEDNFDDWSADIDSAYAESDAIRSSGGKLFRGDTEQAKALLRKYRSRKVGRVEISANSGLADYRDIEIAVSNPPDRRQILDRPVTRQSLQSGLYMPRQTVEDELATELEKFILRADSVGKFGIFWIGGRSGDGKSTLLARSPLGLVNQTDTDYIFVDNLAALQTLDILTPIWAARRIVLIINDLFESPADRELMLIRSLISNCRFAVESGFVQGITIATCGPDPELDLFRQHFTDIEIHRFETPDPSVEEKRKLAEWFGYNEQVGHLRESDLLVEFLFCLQVGMTLAQFSVSFRARLSSFPGSFDRIQLVVTSSAFGLPAPVTILGGDHDTEAVLNRLADDDQRHFWFDEVDYGRCVLFSHNAICKSLIRFWMSTSVTQERAVQASHIVSKLFDALEAEELYAFRLIERVRLHGYHLSQICREDVSPTRFLELLASRVRERSLGWSNVHAGYVSNLAIERDRDRGLTYLEAIGDEGLVIEAGTNADAILVAKIAEVSSFLGGAFEDLRDRCIDQLLGPNLGPVSGYALGHLIARRVASPELAERWMSFFPEATRPPELICSAAPSEATVREAMNWLGENLPIQQSAKVAAWLVAQQNTIAEVLEVLGDWLRQSDIHGQFSVVAQILKEFPNSVEFAATAIDWIERYRGAPGTENVVARLVRTAPLSENVVLAVIGYVRHQFENGVQIEALIRRLEPVLLAIISVWPRRAQPAIRCSRRLVSMTSSTDQALKLHAATMSKCSRPEELGKFYQLTLSLIETNFDQPFLASHLSTFVKEFRMSPDILGIGYRWLRESEFRRVGGGVFAALAKHGKVSSEQLEDLWEWIDEFQDDRAVHNSIWVYFREFHAHEEVRQRVRGWLDSHEHYFGSIVLREHIARSFPRHSEEMGKPNFGKNAAFFDVPTLEFERHRFDFLQDEKSARALETEIRNDPHNPASINGMSSLLNRRVVNYDPLPGALCFLKANRENARITNVVTKLINSFEIDEVSLDLIRSWISKNTNSPGVNISVQAALDKGLIQEGDEEFGWLGTWAFQRRRHFGKNADQLLVSLMRNGFFQGENEARLGSILNALHSNRLRHLFLAGAYRFYPQYVENTLGSTSDQRWVDLWTSAIKWEQCPVETQELFYSWCERELPSHILDLIGTRVRASLPDCWIEIERLPVQVVERLEPPTDSGFEVIF